MNLARKLRQRGRNLLPITGYQFDRPIVILQSDDWGRVGVRDRDGFERLRSAGIALGERPYDFYTLETAEDVSELATLLKRHRDARGGTPSLEMNFVPMNLDFALMEAEGSRQIGLLPLAEGLPRGWERPGLVEAYRSGISDGIFIPALHGSTHFCRGAVERRLESNDEAASLLRKLWNSGTPYIHWRMPWIGYEYWDPGRDEDERFLPAEMQRQLIGQSVGAFARLFSTLPRSACAPGYRANEDTHAAWAQHGIHVAQNGPGTMAPPYIDRYGMLQIHRNVEFEPATDDAFSVKTCIEQATACFGRGIPAIVSVHSINFHSTLKDFRSRALQCLDEFFTALESRHPNLLYFGDEDLWQLVNGNLPGGQSVSNVTVTRKNFRMATFARQVDI